MERAPPLSDAARTSLNVPGLEADGSISTAHIAPSGATGQVLTRTATGKAWQDLGAGDFTLSQIGTYQFPAGFTTGQDDQLFDTGFTGPANTAQVYHVVFGDNNGRFGTALFLGSEIAGLNAEAAPVWVDGSTVGVSELAGNSRSFPIGTNRALYLGITTGGNLSIGSTHSGIRPYVTLSEVDGGGGTDTNDYVDSASLSLSGANRLSFSLGRTGSLAAVPSNSITLPRGGVIVPTSVSHSGNTYTITTGLGLTSIPAGAQFLFQPGATNAGAVNVIVDSVSGTHNVILANGAFFGQIEAVPAGLLRVGDVYILIWDHNNAEFGLFPTKVGLSAFYSTGTGANEIPVLNAGGILDSGVLASGGSADQVLTRTATGQAWEDSGTGIGDITAVRTAGRSGLQGGSLTGDVDLIIDLSNLSILASTFIQDGDYFFIQDVTDSGNPRKRTTLGSIMAFAVLGESTTSSGGGKIRVADGGITNTQLAITGTPASGQVIAWDGSALLWADQTGMGGGLLTVATDTAFGGVGTSGDPLTLAVGGAAFPTIPLDKGGTGATTAAAARTAFGLGRLQRFVLSAMLLPTLRCCNPMPRSYRIPSGTCPARRRPSPD